METLKKVGRFIVPKKKLSEDGRDEWPSRAAFILASASGCAGMGNLLRYPSVLYNNAGLTWYIPYLIAIFFIAIPVLMLEIAIGQAFRGGTVIAYNNVNQKLKGVGLAVIYVAFTVTPYFVVNLSWIMVYFKASFWSPLPWKGRVNEFFYQDVIANVDPVMGDNGYLTYPGTAVIGETLGWAVFTFFLVWLSIFQGPSITGRVVYFTMGLPIVVVIILIGRSCSLPNAGEGLALVWTNWDNAKIASGSLWQSACGQVFFSIGVGFGYFTSYASYNQKFSNAVQDSFIIALSNAFFENCCSLAVLAAVGYLQLWPDPEKPLGSFDVGFLTLPAVMAELPGANFWSFCLFFTLMVLGYSSAFAMLDAAVSALHDSQMLKTWSRVQVCTLLTIISFLLSIPYCTEFGYYYLTGVDAWVNNVALVFVVWAECVTSTTLYRWRDVHGEVGAVAFWLSNAGFFLGQILGVAVAQAVSPAAGAGLGFGLYIVGTALSVILAKTPQAHNIPQFWSRNPYLRRFYFLAFYSGEMLRTDLNQIVGTGNNWNIPVFWGPLLRYISAPILAIVYSFSYPDFYKVRNDPMHIFGFFVGHLGLVFALAGFIVPRWFDCLIPPARRGEGKIPYAPGVPADFGLDGEHPEQQSMHDSTGSSHGEKKEVKDTETNKNEANVVS